MSLAMSIAPGAWGLPSRGSSDDARYASGNAEKGFSHLKDSLAFGLFTKKSFEELRQVFIDCRQANWDGYRAEPVVSATYELAVLLLKRLPLGVEPPSLSAEPDGHLTMEWYRSPRRTLSLSISPKGELHYAALLGARRAYGTEPFVGDLPESIMNLINKVMMS